MRRQLTHMMHFWGVRGSIPTPGKETTRYGGNTSCLSLALDDNHTLVLDAGTGLRVLGQKEYRNPHVFYFLLSHLHWDHIQGFPFFRPIMDPDATIVFLNDDGNAYSDVVLGQLDGIRFPVEQSALRATIKCGSQDHQNILGPFGVSFSSDNMLHVGTCHGFRVTRDDCSWVFMTDNELPEDPEGSDMRRLIQFASGADVLIHDAQYNSAEMKAKKGWGHSSFEKACAFGVASNVKKLVIFHHDPSRTDAQLDEVLIQARAWVAQQDSELEVVMAREGLLL